MNNIQQDLLSIIDSLLADKMNEIKYTRYLEGKVISANSNDALIEINGDKVTLPIRRGLSISAGDIVWICLPFGHLTNGFVDLIRLN